jgi:hypothetical protein
MSFFLTLLIIAKKSAKISSTYCTMTTACQVVRIGKPQGGQK